MVVLELVTSTSNGKEHSLPVGYRPVRVRKSVTAEVGPTGNFPNYANPSRPKYIVLL